VSRGKTKEKRKSENNKNKRQKRKRDWAMRERGAHSISAAAQDYIIIII
jgi:hypothetical protein